MINLSIDGHLWYGKKMRFLNAFKLIEGVGSQKLAILTAFFHTPQNAWQASLSDIQAAGISQKLAEKIADEKKCINPDAEWEKLAREDIEVLSVNDENYPKLLKEVHLPPYIIYKRGKLNLNAHLAISIVGSRKFTSYGHQAAMSITRDLATAGVNVVSGLAIGIDAISHGAAMSASGPTVAVLGSGIDDASIFPRTNYNLARDIIDNGGAIISEYPFGTPPGPSTFPARNRIIAGISKGTLVIEAGEKSGTLITTDYALEYSRDIFAVPGSIFSPVSIGTNNLIRNGAKPVMSAKDILEEYDLSAKKDVSREPKITENENEKILLKILSCDPLHIDNISRLAKLETMAVSSTLTVMEIKGWAKNVGGQNYVLL